jgi:quinol monooxygenase YgiN
MKSISIIIKVRPEKRKEFQQTIFSLQNERKEGKGRKIFMIDQNPDNQNVFHLTYEWTANQESEAYFNSENFSVLVGALKTLCAEYNEAFIKVTNKHRKRTKNLKIN